MKKQTKKLVLAKETIRHLELESVKGGTQGTEYCFASETCSCGPATSCDSCLPNFDPLESTDC